MTGGGQGAVSRWWSQLRDLSRRRGDDATLASMVCLGALGIAVLQVLVPVVPLTALVIPMVVGSTILGPRVLPATLVFVLALMGVVVVLTPHLLDGRRIGGVVSIFVIGLIVLASSIRRGRLGIAGSRGESMLVDLRDRIQSQARIPALPQGWYADSVLRSAGGSLFAGDFMVASLVDSHLQVVMVDVSGKGEEAGPRSLLLSGAFGGLLNAVPPGEFLPAANDYLLRQDWSEGFATAVHLSVDLDTGEFALRSAGHPPAAQLWSGSGRWQVHTAEGPILGLMEGAEFPPLPGSLGRDDLLLLFTDGLVESRSRDISSGIDRLLGEAELLSREGFDRGAHRLVDRLHIAGDDQALLMLQRR